MAPLATVTCGHWRSVAILNTVDKRLRMFNAHAHRERLGFEEYSLVRQQFINLAPRVARCQNHGIAGDLASIGQNHSAHTPVVDYKIGDARFKVNFAPALPTRG